MSVKPEVIHTTSTWHGSFLQAEILHYRNERGGILEWEAFRRIGCNGIVAIVPFTNDGGVILTKQFRPPVNKYVIEFPAGLNDRNETLEEVAKRELLEETGYRAQKLTFLAEGPLSSGASSEILNVYLAEDIVYSGNQSPEESEHIDVLILPRKGFYERLFGLFHDDAYIDLKMPGLFRLAEMKCSG